MPRPKRKVLPMDSAPPGATNDVLTTTLTRSKRMKPDDEMRVAVGIDFGTTLTCIAFKLYFVRRDSRGKVIDVQEPDSPDMLVRFTSLHDQQSTPLCDNVCIYHGDELLVGDLARNHEAVIEATQDDSEGQPGSRLMRYLKLAVCGDINMNRLASSANVAVGAATMREHFSRIQAACRAHGMENDTYKMVAECIRVLWEAYAARDIFNTYKPTYGDVLDKAKLDIVVTRPSVWTFVEDQRFVQATEEALASTRVANIAVFDEAHAVLAGMVGHPHVESQLKKGSIVLVLDIGGGTADLASVLVHSKSPLCLRDAGISSSGGMFGASIVTAYFEKTIQELIKPIYERSEAARGPAAVPWSRICRELVKHFEGHMRFYRGLGKREKLSDIARRLPVMGLPSIPRDDLKKRGYSLEHGQLGITHREFQRLFSVCIAGIVDLTKKQISGTTKDNKTAQVGKDIKGLFVVGGFSKNVFLQTTLVEQLRDVFDEKLIFFPPTFEKSAVAKGAMRYAMHRNLLDRRMLQVSVGFKQSLDWTTPEITPPMQFHIEDSPWKANTEILSDAVRWVFLRGTLVKQIEEVVFNGTRSVNCNGPFEISEDLYCSPIRCRAEEYEHPDHDWVFAPLQSPNTNITKVGTLCFAVRDPSLYPAWFVNQKHSLDGHVYSEIEYEIVARWEGLRLRWKLEIPASGHFDCRDDEHKCPGRLDSRKCPGYGKEPLIRESVCNLGAAFGDEQGKGANYVLRGALQDDTFEREDQRATLTEQHDPDYVDEWVAELSS